MIVLDLVVEAPVAKGGNTYTNCWTNGNSEIVYEPKMNLWIYLSIYLSIYLYMYIYI